MPLTLFSIALIYIGISICLLNMYTFINSIINQNLQKISVPLGSVFYSLGFTFYALLDIKFKNWKIIFIFFYIIPIAVFILIFIKTYYIYVYDDF